MPIEPKPGFLYETKNGRLWLCLNEILFAKRTGYILDGETRMYPTSRIVYGCKNQYLRWSKSLETKLANRKDFNALVRILAATDDGKSWTQKGQFATKVDTSKFVKEIKQIIDPSLTTTENIISPVWTTNESDQRKFFTEYQIYNRRQSRTMLPTRFIGACELFVNFFKTAGIRDATIDELLELRSFLRNYLISHDLTGTYTVSCPLTREIFDDVAAHNPNIIEYVTREDKIRLKPTVDLNELTGRNVLPPDIQAAITEYVNQNY